MCITYLGTEQHSVRYTEVEIQCCTCETYNVIESMFPQ